MGIRHFDIGIHDDDLLASFLCRARTSARRPSLFEMPDSSSSKRREKCLLHAGDILYTPSGFAAAAAAG